MQLEETTNYYLFNIETNDAPTMGMDGGYLSNLPYAPAQGTVQTATTTAPTQDIGADPPLHCIDYLANLKVRTFYDHLLHLAACVYSRRHTPIHSLIDVALSVVIDYVRRCVPDNANMRRIKHFADLHEPNSLELVKGICHDAVIESITGTHHDETLAHLLWRCFRSFNYLDGEPAETRDLPDDHQCDDADAPIDQEMSPTE